MATSLDQINPKSKSAYIYQWQIFLYNQGFTIVGTADSLWGQHTSTATEEFQSKYGLGHPTYKGTGDVYADAATIQQAQKLGFDFPVIPNLEIPAQSNSVLDISHYQGTVDFQKVYEAGIRAVVNKCTQGTDPYLNDSSYSTNKTQALKAGLLWGAYHFGVKSTDSSNGGTAQANYFLDHVGKDGDTVLALDWENIGSRIMSVSEVVDVINTIYNTTNIYPLLYTRKDIIVRSGATSSQLDILKQCPLWLSAYPWSPPGTLKMPVLPSGWNSYTIWQFSDGTHGQGAVPVNGIHGPCDRDIFNGSETDLTSFWTANQY
ncbi:MAG: glycoside hydrolase family 25 protein [Bacteroidota bacterium]